MEKRECRDERFEFKPGCCFGYYDRNAKECMKCAKAESCRNETKPDKRPRRSKD